MDGETKRDDNKTCMWTCRWDVKGRLLLLQVEAAVINWITAENEFRKMLTPAFAKDLEISEVEVLLLKAYHDSTDSSL
jgi:hypothetical protein